WLTVCAGISFIWVSARTSQPSRCAGTDPNCERCVGTTVLWRAFVRVGRRRRSTMPLMLFAHPFASYCQKALIALYENATPFSFRMLDKSDPSTFAEFEALWPMKRFPLLLDEGRPVAEATIIIEHLGLHHPGPVRLIP